MVRRNRKEVAAVTAFGWALVAMLVLAVGVLAWALCRAAGKADEKADYMTGAE